LHPQVEQEFKFFRKFSLGVDEIWIGEWVNLAVLACVLRATTKKKVVNFLEVRKYTPRENHGPSIFWLPFYRAAWNATRSYDEISVRPSVRLSVRPSVCLSVCQTRAL